MKIFLCHRDIHLTTEPLQNILNRSKPRLFTKIWTWIENIAYVGTLLILQMACLLPKTDYLFAQIVAFILSVLWAFYWDNKMVFAASMDTERIWWKALIKTYISYSCTDCH